MKKFLPIMLLDVVPVVAAYYLLRLADVAEGTALLVATAVGVARVAWVAIKDRRLDGFAACTGLVFALGLALSFVSGDERLLLAVKSLTTGVLAVVLIGTCVAGKPAAFGIAKRFGAEDEATAARWDVLYAHNPAFRHIYLVMTFVWAGALLAESLVRIPLVYLLPIDVTTGLSTVLLLGTLGLAGAWSAWYGKRGELAATA
ncbi:VC0807 family protein [Nonomuraea insulae]|uniref:VC0807 family protein n=1 Tax=Nonomuraea insulae TaxID=1616787 RepID=A0ABW1CQ82_9ACTN